MGESVARCWKWGGWAGPATMTSRARRDVVAGVYK